VLLNFSTCISVVTCDDGRAPPTLRLTMTIPGDYYFQVPIKTDDRDSKLDTATSTLERALGHYPVITVCCAVLPPKNNSTVQQPASIGHTLHIHLTVFQSVASTPSDLAPPPLERNNFKNSAVQGEWNCDCPRSRLTRRQQWPLRGRERPL